MQGESSQYFTRRLERLKFTQRWTDDELSEHVGISRRMLYLMRTGKNPISAKTLWKVEQAERAAGLDPPLPDVGKPSGGDVRGLESDRGNAAGNTGGASVSGASGVKSFPGGMHEDGESYDAGPASARRERTARMLRRLDAIEAEVQKLRTDIEQGG
jgi:transcriptional regulator with XRE-family HTH domain